MVHWCLASLVVDAYSCDTEVHDLETHCRKYIIMYSCTHVYEFQFTRAKVVTYLGIYCRFYV